ncbi:MAG: hypothetical protein IJW39_01970 [Opitutales bacterium]|nr:hypothetical protein [Opitutales bacterium]
MTKKLLISAVVLSAVPVLGLNAQDSASYQKNYSSYLAEWERDLNRRSGIAVSERQTATDEAPSSDSPWAPPRHKRIEQQRGASSSSGNAVSVEAFYAIANDTLSSGDEAEDDINLGGITVQYTFGKYDGLKKGSSSSFIFAPEIEYFASAGIGYGSDEFSEEDPYWNDSYSDEISVLHGQVSVGSNLRWELLEGWDFLVGARLGVSYLSIDYEWKEVWNGLSESGSQTEDAFGLFYGFRVGTNVSLAENHALTFAVDYWGSTARPEFLEKVEAQSYCVFSVGYKYSF